MIKQALGGGQKDPNKPNPSQDPSNPNKQNPQKPYGNPQKDPRDRQK